MVAVGKKPAGFGYFKEKKCRRKGCYEGADNGASSGLGRDIARRLSARGCDLILVARRADRLEELKKQLPTNVETISLDLSREENCLELYERVKGEHVEIVINNAGFGLFGRFDQTDLSTELRMIDTNIKATHILTKLFLRDFIRRGSGKLLKCGEQRGFSARAVNGGVLCL